MLREEVKRAGSPRVKISESAPEAEDSKVFYLVSPVTLERENDFYSVRRTSALCLFCFYYINSSTGAGIYSR